MGDFDIEMIQDIRYDRKRKVKQACEFHINGFSIRFLKVMHCFVKIVLFHVPNVLHVLFFFLICLFIDLHQNCVPFMIKS